MISAKKSLLIAVTMFILGLGGVALCNIISPSTEDSIRQAYTDYSQAINNQDGEAASRLVSKSTIGHYQDLIDNALTIRSPKFDTLPMLNRFMILRLRHSFSRSELAAMDGKELFAIGIEENWLTEGPRPGPEAISDIFVQENLAMVNFEQFPGKPVIFFIREDGAWKLEFGEIMDEMNLYVEENLKKQNMVITNEELLLRLEAELGEIIDPAILDGPIDR